MQKLYTESENKKQVRQKGKEKKDLHTRLSVNTQFNMQ